MKTESDYGYEYAKTDTDYARVDVDAILGGTVDIPEDDYLTMRSAGIENPDARAYWRGYNGYDVQDGKPQKHYMNIETGSVDDHDGWDYETETKETVNAVDLGEVVEVEMIGGEWVEV